MTDTAPSASDRRQEADTPQTSLTAHMRGSSLLAVGRVLSLAINFVTQVLIARYLSVSDFGAFAYALSLAVLFESLTTFGLDRGVTRFLALYDERKDYPRLLGTLVLVIGTILSAGAAIVLLVIGLRGLLAGGVAEGGAAASLLAILVVLAPVQALDNVLSGVLAVFGSARAIFLRKYVLAPVLRLTVVLLLVLGGFDVEFLAVGYVVAGAVGLVLYSGILWRVLGESEVRQQLRLRDARLPVREVFAFTLPLLSTDLVYVSMTTVDVLLLGHLHGADDVAQLRVVQPLANLNLLVYSSFTLLYTPMASRLFEREDRAGVRELYWQTAVWVAVFSFPLFALTATLARPLTLAVFGQEYADSAVLLTVLATGLYLNAAFGFNGLTLRVFGLLRYTLVINVVVVVANVVANLLLIPRLGALGAALATSSSLVLHNVLKQLGLRRGTGIEVFDMHYARLYLVLLLSGGVLAAVEVLANPALWVSLVLVASCSAFVLWSARDLMRLAAAFPVLGRTPVLRRFTRG